MRVFDLAKKDLTQILRDWKSATFMLAMPVIFTLMFGFFFSGVGERGDPRLPAGFIDQDQSKLSAYLIAQLEKSSAIRLEPADGSEEKLEKEVAEEDLVAALIIPAGYGEALLNGEAATVTVIADAGTSGGLSAQNEIQSASSRLTGAVRTANLALQAYEQRQAFPSLAERQAFFESTVDKTLAAWESPPVTLQTKDAVVRQEEQAAPNPYAHTSPGMLVQFSIAGLMSAAEVMVVERKTRSLQRLLTTPILRPQILLGHFLAMLVIVFVQIALLALFGQLFLDLNYLGQPVASLLMVFATTFFAASLGLLIGALAKTEEHVIVFTLVPMFVLAGLGGAWMPLEGASETVQAISHLTPMAWVMDGLKGILLRGWGVAEVLPALGVLSGYALLCLALAVWKFRFE